VLEDEITEAQKLVRTDAYQMSIGEIVGMYEAAELIIDPEFQRLFRWEIGQKSRLIESILLGIPLPSIFVFERSDGKWELIDGLQRVSTILEFMGLLKDDKNKARVPSALVGTKYLPSLNNAVWEKDKLISDPTFKEQSPLNRPLQLAIRRSRIGVEILKRPSDDLTKFELFQRLNAGGTQANPQELRNCIMIMVNAKFFRAVRLAANQSYFISVVGVNDDQIEKQRNMELAVRFLVHVFIPYDGKLDVEEYIDEGTIEIAKSNDAVSAARLIPRTFKLLEASVPTNVLRRFDGARHVGKVGLVGLESIAVGVAKNIDAIEELPDPEEFIQTKSKAFWDQPELNGLTSPGVRGTSRIQRTVPFGERWFKP
jgi:hypothetical protein